MKSLQFRKLFARMMPSTRRGRKASRLKRRLLGEQLELRAMMASAGTWTKLANDAPSGIGTMMLLTDGTVMAQEAGVSNNWFKLTPDATGNYHDGTWSTLPSMSQERLYFGSNVLPDGRVYVLGGEYSAPGGNPTLINTAEIYDSINNSWSNAADFPQSSFGDGQTNLLSNGKILAGYLFGPETYLYDPSNDKWTQTGDKIHGDRSNEETWAMLPDGSILTVDIFVDNKSQRYDPSTGQWLDAGTVPVVLTGPNFGYEMGPGTLLPDGRYFQVGANNLTAIYDPKTNTWVAGPAIPNGLGADDSPGAMLPNGHFIFAVDSPPFGSPTRLFDYDPFSNSWTEVTPPELGNALDQPAFVNRMLILPNGNMLMATFSNELWELTPNGAPDPTWAPNITAITHTGNVYTVTGTQLNGLWEGATYGDDAEMSTNYPIVKLTSPNGTVTYARSMNWTAAVATGQAEVTTQFVLPPNLGNGPFKMNIIANGIESDAINDINNIITLKLDANTSYTEDAAPTILSPNAKLTATAVSTFSGGSLSVKIVSNADVGDTLAITPGSNGITVVGTDVFDGAVQIGSVTTNTGSLLTITFNNSTSTLSIQSLIQSISFSTPSQSPSPQSRGIEFFLDNGSNGSSGHMQTSITVVPVNDAPTSGNVNLPTILEDATSTTGSTITALAVTGFNDVDAGSSMKGIAIVANAATPAQGSWQYSVSSNGTWEDVGLVGPSNALLISTGGRIRFVPAKDFNGSPTPLRYRNIDETFVGNFSGAGTRIFADATTVTPTGPIGITDGAIGIIVTPVNDPPVATVPAQSTSVLQDQLLQYTVSKSFFADVDDAKLTYTVKPQPGASLPSWLSYSSTTGILSGTPTNLDVGVVVVYMEAKDAASATVSLPLTITVVNVNDAPTQLFLDGNTVVENSKNVRVGTFISSDPDPNDRVHYTVDDPRFEVRANQLFIAPGATIDFETERTITVNASVVDNGTPSLSLTLPFTLNVTDVNEFMPEFQPTNFQISEDAQPGTLIGAVQAIDRDYGSVVKYRWVNPSDTFDLDPNTGAIHLKSTMSLDHEKFASYQLFVEAYDNGVPTSATAVSVNVAILDVNEFAPKVDSVALNVLESQLPLSSFAKVLASDGDTSQHLTYSIVASDSNLFLLDSATGELSLATGSKLDFETQTAYSLQVQVTDDGTPSRSSVGTVQILVGDANDPPTGISISSKIVRKGVEGVDIGKLTVIDQDAQQLYELVPQDARFEVKNGRLRLLDGVSFSSADPLNFVVPISIIDKLAGGQTYVLPLPLSRTDSAAWQNPLNPLDPNHDSHVDALDVLSLVNAFNSGTSLLTVPRPAADLLLPDYDADGDNTLSPLDILAVVNSINDGASSGEGESSAKPVPEIVGNVSDSNWARAYSQWEAELEFQRKRRG